MLDQFPNLFPGAAVNVLVFVMTVVMLIRMVVMMIVVVAVLVIGKFPGGNVEDVDLRRCDAAAIDGCKLQGGADVERERRIFKKRTRDARIDERAKQHVSTNACETLEISNSHSYFPVAFASIPMGRTSFIDPER